MANRSHCQSPVRRSLLPLAPLVALLASSLPAPVARAGGEERVDAAGINAPGAVESGLPLYLEVFRGDRPTELIAHLLMRDGKLFATPDELASLGLRIDPDTARPADGFLSLDALPGLEYRYDAAEQRLYLLVPPSLRPQQTLGYRSPEAVEATRGRGVLLNYDAYGQRSGSGSSLAIGSALRWFGRVGSVELTGISRLAGGDSSAYQRLDTRWSYSDPIRLWTWSAGDLITGSLPWSNSVRLGGVQWRRNFGVRPDLITFPVPRFAGQATLPSTIDLLVNNVQQFGSDVQDGPFQIDAFPRISGAGEATLVLRDALGQVTRTTVPIYVDAQRLAPGLSDFSLEVGKVRRGFGDGSSRYAETAASGSMRRGISQSLTLEAHAEATSNLQLAGAGMVWAPAHRWGLVTASIAQSVAGQARGSARSYGYQWNSPAFGFSMTAVRKGSGFRDIGSADAIPTASQASRQDRALFWKPLAHGSMSASWLRFRQADGRSDRVVTASWSRSFRSGLSIAANAFDDSVAGVGAGVSVGYAFTPTLDGNANVDYAKEGSRTELSLRKRSAKESGWGWQLDAGDRDGQFMQASANLRGRFGDTWFGGAHDRGETRFFAQGAGGIAWIGGHGFLTRRINDAFALVSSGGVPGVPVFYENRAAGMTDAHGFLLLPDLRGWQRNRISIDPDVLTGSYRLPPLEQTFTPADGGGFRASFTLSPVHPASAVLHDGHGAPVPAGSRGAIEGSEDVFVVGFDGEAYLENAVQGAILKVDLGDATCTYVLARIPAAVAGTPAALGSLHPTGGCR